MSLRLGDIAPGFTADTTQGSVSLDSWKGNSWAVPFSHPKDFTPLCPTQLGRAASLKGDFEKRNCRLVGLSVDSVESHHRWEGDPKNVPGHGVNFPQIGDPDGAVATPADRKQGKDVISAPALSDEAAKKKFPKGLVATKPPLRVTPQPGK